MDKQFRVPNLKTTAIILLFISPLFFIGCGAALVDKGTLLHSQGRFEEAEYQNRLELQECQNQRAQSSEPISCSEQASDLLRLYAHVGNYQVIIDECPGYLQAYQEYSARSLEMLEHDLRSNMRGKDRQARIDRILDSHQQMLLYGETGFQRHLLNAYIKLNDPINAKRAAKALAACLQKRPIERRHTDAYSHAALLDAYIFLNDENNIQAIGKILTDMVTIKEERDTSGALASVAVDAGFFNSYYKLPAAHAIATFSYYEKNYRKAELLFAYEMEKHRSNLNTLAPLAFLVMGPIPGWSAGKINFDTRILWIDCILRQNRHQEGLDEAIKLEKELLKIVPEFKNADVSWNLDKLIGDALLGLERYDDAIPYYKKAVDKMERQRSDIRGSRLRILYANAKDEIYDKLIDLLYGSGDAIGALDYSERARSRAFLDMLGSSKVTAKDDVSNQLIGQRESIKSDLQAYSRQLAFTKPVESESLIRNINTKKAEFDNVTAQLANQYPDIASMMAVNPAAIQDIQAQLDQKTKIVEYHITNENLLVWVVGRNSFHAQTLPISRAEYDRLVKDVGISLKQRNRTNLHAVSSNLYKALFHPIVHRLNANDRICIVRHGKLHLIPFEVLHDNGRYLVEDYELFYAPSANVFHLSKRKRVQKESSLLALGNPDLSNPNLSLPFAEIEVNGLRPKFKKATVFVGKDANQSNLLMNLSGHNIIHFATHGMFDRQFPMHSGLLLAGNSIADGLLTAEKIYALEMKAYLVTLSACETAVGSVTQADEMVSLSRAFMYAGTPSVLSSLWSVDDEATSYLMQQFYGYLEEENKVSALRKAELDTMKKYRDPILWGAFTLIGDWM